MEKVHRSKERVDLFSLNIDLGNVEWTPCPPPEGLEFEAFLSDPQFEDVRSYQLGTVRGTGVFFQGLAMRRMFCIHQDVVRGLYRVDNFLLKRNYFVSAVVQEKAPTSETKEWVQSTSHPISKSPDRSPAAALAEGMHSADKEDLTFNTNQGVSWADMDEGWEESQFTNPYDPFFDEKKQMNDMKFMNPSFLDSLIKMRQHFVPASEFVRKNPGFAKRTFYLFDYVAMFIDLRDVFENRGDFNSSFIQKRLELLDEIENSVGVLAPLQHAENKDWSSSVKFLCQILNGELQVSFLRVTLYFSMRKVGTRERILSSERLSEATKKFLTGDKSNRRDFAKTTRLNLSALANNKKILLDEDYAMNHLSRVHDE